MTALGILNRITKHVGWCLAHEVSEPPGWRPWWHGEHVKGTWRWEPASKWWL